MLADIFTGIRTALIQQKNISLVKNIAHKSTHCKLKIKKKNNFVRKKINFKVSKTDES